MKKESENQFEEAILSNLSLDELIKRKMEEELQVEIDTVRKVPEKLVVKDIKEVPKDKIFSRDAVYKTFNRKTKQESFINGMQAEAFLGVQLALREKMLNGIVDAFATDDIYVKFVEVKL